MRDLVVIAVESRFIFCYSTFVPVFPIFPFILTYFLQRYLYLLRIFDRISEVVFAAFVVRIMYPFLLKVGCKK